MCEAMLSAAISTAFLPYSRLSSSGGLAVQFTFSPFLSQLCRMIGVNVLPYNLLQVLHSELAPHLIIALIALIALIAQIALLALVALPQLVDLDDDSGDV